MSRINRTVTSISSVVAALGVVSLLSHGAPWPFSLTVALLVAAAILARRDAVGAQLFARATWWSNLVLGLACTLWVAAHGVLVPASVLFIAAGCGVALLASGRLPVGRAFRPLAFRRRLTIGMVFALADAQGFLLWGTIDLAHGLERGDAALAVDGVLVLLGAAVAATAVAALYRLRSWGLLLGAALATMTVVGTLVRRYDHMTPMAVVFVVSALVQISLAVPVLASIIRATRAPERQRDALRAGGARDAARLLSDADATTAPLSSAFNAS